MDEPVCLFTYGTLRKEYGSTFYKMHAEEMEWIQRGKVPGVLYDIGEYPGAVPPLAEQHSIIIGDVFRLKQGKQFLQLLDKYENYDPLNTEGSEYLRMQVGVTMKDGYQLSAWMYWFNGSLIGKKRIQEEDYLIYLNKKAST